MGCHFLLQEIFPTQGLNPGLPHCRQMLYRLSHQGRFIKESRQIGYMVLGTQPFILLSHHLQGAASFFFFFFLILRWIYLFLAALDLRCCAGCLQLLRVRATFCLWCAGFSLQWFLLLPSADSRACGLQQLLPGSSALAQYLTAHGL